MSALLACARSLLVLLLFTLLGAHPAAAEAVGTVTKVENQAQVGSATAVVGTALHMNDVMRTGAKSRLQVTFRDNSTLTLGENARVVVDKYVYNPKSSSAEVALNATRGAIRFAGGKIEQMQNKKITVATPGAALAVRGTHFWAGPINGKYGVLLLNGRVQVSPRRAR
jgi:hypothetical protein